MKALVISAVILMLLSVSACSGNRKDTVGTVGKREVTLAEFEAYLAVKGVSKNDATQRERALTEYLEREALADAIEQQSTIDKALLRAELREQEKEILIGRYFDKVLEDKVGRDAIAAYYSANAAKYEDKKVHAAHILFRVSQRMSDEERKAKLTAAQEAYGRVAKGEDFAAVAQVLSEDTVTGKKGGDLGFLREGSIDARFSEKVFSMQKGEISEPFATTFGFHVVKLLEPAQTVKRPLDAVEGDIRYELRAEAKQAEMKRLRELVKVSRPEGTQAKPTEAVSNATASRN
jgi:peptidyl-prolyl cis-trans isomerase C